MSFKTILNYSPNFDQKKKTKKINFYFSLYRNEKRIDAINRLTDIKSKVSAHYLIKNNGEIITLVPDLYMHGMQEYLLEKL